jgi:hypothetical protein
VHSAVAGAVGMDVRMAPKYHPTPLSGGDRKALSKELGKARAMANILATQSAELRACTTSPAGCGAVVRQSGPPSRSDPATTGFAATPSAIEGLTMCNLYRSRQTTSPV